MNNSYSQLTKYNVVNIDYVVNNWNSNLIIKSVDAKPSRTYVQVTAPDGGNYLFIGVIYETTENVNDTILYQCDIKSGASSSNTTLYKCYTGQGYYVLKDCKNYGFYLNTYWSRSTLTPGTITAQDILGTYTTNANIYYNNTYTDTIQYTYFQKITGYDSEGDPVYTLRGTDIIPSSTTLSTSDRFIVPGGAIGYANTAYYAHNTERQVWFKLPD